MMCHKLTKHLINTRSRCWSQAHTSAVSVWHCLNTINAQISLEKLFKWFIGLSPKLNKRMDFLSTFNLIAIVRFFITVGILFLILTHSEIQVQFVWINSTKNQFNLRMKYSSFSWNWIFTNASNPVNQPPLLAIRFLCYGCLSDVTSLMSFNFSPKNVTRIKQKTYSSILMCYLLNSVNINPFCYRHL